MLATLLLAALDAEAWDGQLGKADNIPSLFSV
jgi:hypothetical protein